MQRTFYKAALLRTIINIVGFGTLLLIFCFYFNKFLHADWSWEPNQLKGIVIQAEKNRTYPPEEFFSDFGFNIPEYNVVEHVLFLYGPDHRREVKIIPKNTVDSLFLMRQVETNSNGFEEIEFDKGMFYARKRSTEYMITILPNDTLYIIENKR